MPELRKLFEELEKKNPATSNIAGYIADERDELDGKLKPIFKYHVSSSENLPAAVVVFDLVGKKFGKVYTNLKKSHWVYTYTSVAGGEGSGDDLLRAADSNAVAAKAVSMGEGNGKVRVFAGEGASPGPLQGGGLFQAAKSLHDSESLVTYKGVENHTRDKGLHRALRYYMLAAYSLLGKGAESNYDKGNYIAALLVNDEGKILSYGVNSGWFHHGETNMLLNYFRAHSGDATFPSNTIIFSTLTPCKQCSKYLQGTRPADSVIFIGQRDPGSRGSEGEKFGVHLSAVTDPIRNRVATPIMEDRPTGEIRTIKGVGWAPTRTVAITERVKTGETVEKYMVETLLSEKMGDGATVAEQIGKKCQDVLKQSKGTLTYKHSNNLNRNQDLGDQLVKFQVLEYLNTWIDGVNISSQLKPIS